jgi:large subunit ribosomal protein L47
MTQRGIKQALTERYYSWRDAETIAKSDPEIDLSGSGPIYNPSDFEEPVEELAEAQLEAEVKPHEVITEPVMKPEERTIPAA